MHQLNLPSGARLEVSKTPEQIRAEAALAAADDVAAIVRALNITPNEDAMFQQATMLFWRHREEIQTAATTLHHCDADHPCHPVKVADQPS